MATTVTQLLSTFATEFYPECPAPIPQRLFTTAYRELLTAAQVRNNVVYITLTANQRDYDLPVTVMKIHEAYYEESSDSGSWYQLYSTNLDKLATIEPGWRSPSYQSTPERYYISSAPSGDTAKPRIGFDPIPLTSSNPTYPRVALYVTDYAELTTTDELPSNLLSDNYLLYRMAQLWAERADQDMAAYYKDRATEELAQEVSFVKAQQAHDPEFQFVTPFINHSRSI